VWDQKPFYIDAYLNYVDVRDAAEVILKLLDHPAQGQRYILSASTIHFYEFFSQIAKNLNKRAPAIKLDKTLLRFIAGFESLRSRIAKTEPLITKETARLANTHFTYSNEKIRNTLNFSFKSIENTLSWCSDYYLNYYAKK
jgi:nucleoside-diphosphate-sugar epimerase